MKKITLFLFTSALSIFGAFSQPANDLPCGAILLPVNLDGNCVNSVLTFTGNETDSNIGVPICAGAFYSGKDLWYKFEMPTGGSVQIIASSDSFINDIALEVFTGSDCNTLTAYDCDDDGNPNGPPDDLFPQINIVQPEGSIVYFRIWDLDDLGAGTVNICINKIDAPLITDNDECSTANDLLPTNDCTPVLTTNFQSTNSPDADPSCTPYYEGLDVWYQITLDDNDDYNVSIETSGDPGSSVYDTGIAVYSGSCGSLTEIACDDDGGTDLFSKVDVPNRRNEVLYVRVFMVGLAQSGNFNICATAMSTLGTTEIETQDFKLFPNPSRDIVHLKFNSLSGSKFTINIFNLQGKLVKEFTPTLNQQNVALDISQLNTGMYFVKLNNGTNEVTKKLFVQ
ncbi:T9SS type A sorting domain-containing protein [Aestuariivivens sediminis]|uniref:T9SS type A sorting domain-containing protein n=1 Tax=Aestuariivivens sediminis TaxID=2913557 RepID=UPI001F5927DC|nr:T9SS type A sorting domain-containing protein [Aestuariivivens sediminis]